MPVVTLYLDRLKQLVKGSISVDSIIEKIPYLGLDVEEVDEDHIRLEYNPNRLDYSTDYGIARALNGLLGFDLGCPEYTPGKGEIRVLVDPTVDTIRPYIVSLVARDLCLDDESIRQVITMQEDIHNGIGRKRQKVSIGIHNLDEVESPISYTTAPPDFGFIPLGSNRTMSMQEILGTTDVGREYGEIVSGHKRYPILMDSRSQVLSFPPIINGELTRVTQATRNLFIDVTATDLETSEDALSVLSTTLQDAGATIETVTVKYKEKTTVTPDLKPYIMRLNSGLANRLLGLNLSQKEMAKCLQRCRMNATPKDKWIDVVAPRYRFDLLHEVDLVEEVAIGFGVEKLTPSLPAAIAIGGLNKIQKSLSRIREILVALGLIEVMNFSLTSEDILYRKMNRKTRSQALRIESPKTAEHEFLRDCLMPSLLSNLSRNVHEEYPQRIFEVSETFQRDNSKITKIRDEYHVAVAVAHSTANFTEAKSYLESFLSQVFNKKCSTSPRDHYAFSKGRAAEIHVSGGVIGIIGEINPIILERFGLKTLVSAYELDLTHL